MTRIIRLQAENFKRLVAVDIHADGNLIVLSGKNRQGKTSILDAILAVLKGRKFTRETSQTIREGESEAWVRIEIGDDPEHIQYIATRKWTDEGAGTLTLESSDHARYSSPQKLLDEIVGEVSFDPLSFLELDAAKQVEALGKALGPSLPFDLNELTALHKGTFEQRTEVGREVTKLEGALSQYPPADASLPTEEVAVADLLAKHHEAQEHNRRRNESEQKAARAALDIIEAENALAAAQRVLKNAKADAEAASAEFAMYAPEIDLTALLDEMDRIDDTNTKIRAQVNRAAVAAELADRTAEVDKLTAKLKALDKQKAEGIAAAKFPVPELSFGDDGVTFNGRKFSQASTEERYRASFGIAIASNPQLRVCRIDKGEALDSESLKVLAALADEHDMQVWITKVSDDTNVGFVIADGRVSA